MERQQRVSEAGFIWPLFAMGLVCRINEAPIYRLDFWFFSSRKRTREALVEKLRKFWSWGVVLSTMKAGKFKS